MKNLLTILLTVVISATSVLAQVPQGISYQAIAFNSGGSPVANGNVGVRVSILDNSATGTLIYSETHTKTTNAQGLFNLNIGQGSPTTGIFSSINWATNSKFLKVEIDPNGGTNYTTVGTNQLMSVPFALFAEKANGLSSNSSLNDDIINNRYTNFAFYDNSDDKTYAFNSLTGSWISQSGGSSTSGTIVGSNGNFAFYDNSDDKTYAFSKTLNSWVGQTGGSSTSGTIVGSNGNFAFYDNSDDKTYAFNSATGVWVGQTGGSSTSGTIVGSNGNFAFYDNSDDKTYAFSKTLNSWVGQTGGSSTSGTIVSSNGSFAFYDNSDDKTYVFNKALNIWISQSGGSTTNGTIVVSESN